MKFLLSVLVTPVVILLSSIHVLAEIRTKTIEYKQGSTVLEGYLDTPDLSGGCGGVEEWRSGGVEEWGKINI